MVSSTGHRFRVILGFIMSVPKPLEKRPGALKPLILDGRKLRDLGSIRLREVISRYSSKPTLVIIQVGKLDESTAYIEQKKKFAEKVGARVLHKQFPDSVTEGRLISAIGEFNRDRLIHGVIVQLPIPARLDKQKIIDMIAWGKDVDGMTSTNKRLFELGDNRAIVPATARGVRALLQGYGFSVSGKRATIIGRSALVGAPIATLLAREGATVTVCHRGTEDISLKSRQADVLVVAIGQPRYITPEYVSAGQIVVDVGINSVAGKLSHQAHGELLGKTNDKSFDPARVEKLEEEIPRRHLVGDVDFDKVAPIVAAISPVPGGVGPMTVLSLFENLLEATVRN